MNLTGNVAIFLAPQKPLEIREYLVTEPRGEQVRLRLVRSGICGTDMHIFEGRLPVPAPLIPGHEFLGEVESLGPQAVYDGLGKVLRVGDLALACVAQPCGECFCCQQGETASCLNFGVTYVKDPAQAPHFFGGYADYLFSPAENLVKIPSGISVDAVAAFPCAGPTVIRAFDFAGNLSGDEFVVVQGTGPVGLFAIAWAAQAGCHVVAIGSGKNPQRTKLARSLGAKAVIDFRATTTEERQALIRERAKKVKRGDGADVVFEASGSLSAFAEGLSLVRTLGRFIVPGQYSDSGTVEIAPQAITFRAIKIIGSGQYKLTDLAVYLKFLKQHPTLQTKLARCITHRYTVTEANTAWQNAAQGRSIKAVFEA